MDNKQSILEQLDAVIDRNYKQAAQDGGFCDMNEYLVTQSQIHVKFFVKKMMNDPNLECSLKHALDVYVQTAFAISEQWPAEVNADG